MKTQFGIVGRNGENTAEKGPSSAIQQQALGKRYPNLYKHLTFVARTEGNFLLSSPITRQIRRDAELLHTRINDIYLLEHLLSMTVTFKGKKLFFQRNRN